MMKNCISKYDGLTSVIPKKIIINSFYNLYSFFEDISDISYDKKNENALWSPCLVSGKRSNANFVQMNYLVYDIDSGNISENIFDNIPYENITYRTFRHEDENKKYRIIFDISEPIRSIHEFKFAWNLFAEQLQSEHGIYVDRQCNDVSRGYYMPCISPTSHANVIYRSGETLSFSGLVVPEQPAQKPIQILPAQEDDNYYYVSIIDKTQNDFGDKKFYKHLDTWKSIPNGEHYTAFYGMISAVKCAWQRTHHTAIPDHVLEHAMCEIDSVGCNYMGQSTHGIEYIRKKIRQNNG